MPSLSAGGHCQQSEQYGQAQEDELQRAVAFQGAEEHEQGKDAPQAQIDAQEVGVCRCGPILGISRMATGSARTSRKR